MITDHSSFRAQKVRLYDFCEHSRETFFWFLNSGYKLFCNKSFISLLRQHLLNLLLISSHGRVESLSECVYLFAFVLGAFLVNLSLFCAVDGVLLVQLQHLHFLLDGLHGWCVVFPLAAEEKRRGEEESLFWETAERKPLQRNSGLLWKLLWRVWESAVPSLWFVPLEGLSVWSWAFVHVWEALDPHSPVRLKKRSGLFSAWE